MRSSLGLYTTMAMMLISSPSNSMCGANVAGGVKRQRPLHGQHLEAFYGAFLSYGAHKFVADPPPTPPPRRHCFDFTTTSTSMKSWRHPATGAAGLASGATQMQLHMRRNFQLSAVARGFMTRQNPFSSGSLSSAPRPPPSPKATPIAPPCNVAVLARGDSGDDLERCRRLAQQLGAALVVPRQEGDADQGKEQEEREGRAAGAVGDGAEGGNGGFKFTMLFDERGRLALDQPGSGFNPLVVDFSGGKTGFRSKHQGKTEQVVKAAALPKRRAVASTSAAVAGTNEPSRQSFASSPPPTGDTGSDDNNKGAAPLPLLWDLTAGLGTDSFLLAQAGWRVEMFERSPVVAALVQDALDRARAGDDEAARTAASRMSLTVADSTEFLATFGSSPPATQAVAAASGEEDASAGAPRPCVVYLDPMFPQPRKSKKRKSALVKKGMQMLQALLEEEGEEGQERSAGTHQNDGGDFGDRRGVEVGEGVREERGEERRLFDVAISLAARKVVVKRPVHGSAIVQHVKPSHAVVSKNGRFDVYIVPPRG